MMEFIQGLDMEQIGTVALAFVGLFAAIAAMTPNEADNKIVDVLYKAINLFGLNVNKAKNDPNA